MGDFPCSGEQRKAFWKKPTSNWIGMRSRRARDRAFTERRSLACHGLSSEGKERIPGREEMEGVPETEEEKNRG